MVVGKTETDEKDKSTTQDLVSDSSGMPVQHAIRYKKKVSGAVNRSDGFPRTRPGEGKIKKQMKNEENWKNAKNEKMTKIQKAAPHSYPQLR